MVSAGWETGVINYRPFTIRDGDQWPWRL